MQIIIKYLCIKNLKSIIVAAVSLVIFSSCQKQEKIEPIYRTQISQALNQLSLNTDFISLPKVPYPVSTIARLKKVDSALLDPPGMINTGEAIKNTQWNNTRSDYLKTILNHLDINNALTSSPVAENRQSTNQLSFTSEFKAIEVSSLPKGVISSALDILSTIYNIKKYWPQYTGDPTTEELEKMKVHLKNSIKFYGTNVDEHTLENDIYNVLGQRAQLPAISNQLLTLFSTIEDAIPLLQQNKDAIKTQDFSTKYGRIRIAGIENNTHTGDFLLLIDLGGDDKYIDQGSEQTINKFSVVIDLSGNDSVSWDKTTGPATGMLGLSTWIDLEGNDTYNGSNYGAGSAVLGGGLFWDESGNDTYNGNVRTQGAGQYGIGIFVDGGGNDQYTANLFSQGFGGPGGIGIQIDFSGNDQYKCGGKFPDQHKKRQQRHLETHYLSMCQGFSFGIRPKISGGIGVLLDKNGDDIYSADIFGQGSSYWFGLGMLIDANGNDRYKGFEHVQGEGLHLSAGFLGDWSGDDTYTGYEHAQGVGVDRAAGILYDQSGDDIYSANNESQGTGVKPFGVGILIDQGGNDFYKAIRESQGYAKPDTSKPAEYWPIGILYDNSGIDEIEQPYIQPIGKGGRIQNKRGISFDRGIE